MVATRARSRLRARSATGATTMPTPIIVRGSGLDNYVPTVRRVNEADLKARFTTQHLTPIDGEPSFTKMQRVEQELASNALMVFHA